MAAPFKSAYSAVIITKNEEKYIGKCIEAILPLTNDIVVVDSGSTDATVDIAKSLGARTFYHSWEGYGANKNYGISLTENDWILSVDADEIIDDQLYRTLKSLQPHKNCIYQLNSLVNYCGCWIRHSGWYPVWKNRLHHKEVAEWDLSPVHEDLQPNQSVSYIKLPGHLLHYSYDTVDDHYQKLDNYAKLQSLKWHENGRKIGALRRWLGPAFQFVKTYIFRLGFLDGKAGYQIAKMNALAEKRKIYYFHRKADNG